ncbi:putative mitochondrial glutathione transporter SLC25A40 [Acropora cervicornis]|uniref:Mitochondrial glutathione transporter SLC25A40 n=1 Tax=Acropora cervicornis TaxID=6130 RepID=A0AAD9QC89_ACRCE|nr:putative mitochondrial glutathione transporter SLC25A40 [Acropora cervicornis]
MVSLAPSGGEITPFQQVLASGSGALITSFLVTPLDVVKTRLQAQLKPIPKSHCYLFCNGLMDHLCLCTSPGSPFRPFPQVPHPQFNSTMDALIKIPRYEGFLALWRGLPPTLVMAVPNTMIYFTLYDQLKVMYGFVEGEKNIWSPMFAGTTARTISITCISPIEMIRTKMQARKGFSYKELVTVVRNAIQHGGLLSLWQGLGPTLLRDVPFSAIYWMNYEALKNKFSYLGFSASFFSGLFSGALFLVINIEYSFNIIEETVLENNFAGHFFQIAALVTTPFDVIKTHRQIELGELVFNQAREGKKLSFTVFLLFELYKERGWRSLFAGVSARIMKVAPACAIMVSTYELSKSFFRKHNVEKSASVTAEVSP